MRFPPHQEPHVSINNSVSSNPRDTPLNRRLGAFNESDSGFDSAQSPAVAYAASIETSLPTSRSASSSTNKVGSARKTHRTPRAAAAPESPSMAATSMSLIDLSINSSVSVISGGVQRVASSVDSSAYVSSLRLRVFNNRTFGAGSSSSWDPDFNLPAIFSGRESELYGGGGSSPNDHLPNNNIPHLAAFGTVNSPLHDDESEDGDSDRGMCRVVDSITRIRCRAATLLPPISTSGVQEGIPNHSTDGQAGQSDSLSAGTPRSLIGLLTPRNSEPRHSPDSSSYSLGSMWKGLASSS